MKNFYEFVRFLYKKKENSLMNLLLILNKYKKVALIFINKKGNLKLH